MDDPEHIDHALKHRNIFETNTSAKNEDIPVDNPTKTISSDAGKPCIIPTCRCICQHKHIRTERDDKPIPYASYTQAQVTGARDHCPEQGHGLSD